MAIIKDIERFDGMQNEAKLAWDWLRRLPEYKADYAKMRKSINLTLQSDLKEKYGFYPLINPNEKCLPQYAPSGFWVAFGRLLKQDSLDSGVKFQYPSYIDLDNYQNPRKYKKYNYKTQELLDKITLEIDPRKPINFILNQIESYLRRVKKVYKIKEKKPRIADLSSVYRDRVMNKLGYKKKDIRKATAPFTDNDEVNESKRKKGYRISKKADAIEGTQKL